MDASKVNLPLAQGAALSKEEAPVTVLTLSLTPSDVSSFFDPFPTKRRPSAIS